MSIEQDAPVAAVRVDLRRAPASAVPPAALASAQQQEAPRLVLIDRAADLAAHQHLYEELLSHGSYEPARALCLAVGPPEPSAAGSAAPGWALRRPRSLCPPAAGILWISERGFADGGADAPAAGAQDPEASRASEDPGDATVDPLVEVLAEPPVFDAVLEALAGVAHGIAVPAPYVLEQDLTEAARARAWRQALDGLIGPEVPAALPVATAGGDAQRLLPAELAALAGGELPKSLENGRHWLRPDGEAEQAHRACSAALRHAEDGRAQVRGVAGLLGRASRTADLPGRLTGLSHALDTYRATVEAALTEADGLGLDGERRAALHRRGIDLTDLPETSPERVVPGLRRYTEEMLARRIPLRAAAARLADLADGATPAGSASRLSRLDELCPRRYLDRLCSPAPFLVGNASGYRDALPALATGLAAGLWPGVGWVLGPLVALLGAGLTALMLHRRPNRSPDGRQDGGGSGGAGRQLLGGLAGALAGAVAGSTMGLPVWAGPAALSAALAAVLLLAAQRWSAAVDSWWEEMDPAGSERVVADVDELLADTVVHEWLLADARLRCADAARSVAGLLWNLAESVGNRPVAGHDARPAPRYPAGASDGAGGAAGTGSLPPLEPARSPAHPKDPWDPGDSWDRDDMADPKDGDDGRPGAADAWQWGPERPDQAGGYGSDGADPGVASGTRTVPGTPPDSLPETGGRGAWGVGDLVPAVSPSWLERETGDGGPALVETLVADLSDGVLDLLGPVWGTVDRDPAAVDRLHTDRAMAELLDQEHGLLTRDCAASPPPFARKPEHRPGPAALLGFAADRAAEAVETADHDRRVRPLCAPGMRRALSRDPGAVRRVRFAPEAVRRGTVRDLTGDGWDSRWEDVVWTPAGRYAGVLRLVPLHSGVVRTIRPLAVEPETATPEPAAPGTASPGAEPYGRAGRQSSSSTGERGVR